MLLSGCLGGADEPAPTVTVTMSATPTPEPTVTVTATPAPVVEPEPPADVAPQAPDVIPPEDEIVITQPTENGSRPHATGTVQVDANGVPSRYTVAEGDIAVEICTRFGRYIWQLGDANGNVLENPFLIHAGDTIQLLANELPEGYVVPGT